MSKLFAMFYFFLLSAFVMFSYLFVDPNLGYLRNIYTGFGLSYRIEVTIGYTVFLILFVAMQYLLLKRVERNDISRKILKKVILTSTIIFLFSYSAVVSYDIFNYMNTAKVTYGYHENPYVVMPVDISNNPYNSFTRAANKTALYGPIWIALTALPHYLSFGNFVISMILFKILVAFFYFGICYLLWKLSKDVYVVSFFALNPLVLTETFVSGHNDVVMMFFVLLSFYLFTQKKILLAVGVFIASVLIKYASIVLFPVIIYLIFSAYTNRKINWKYIYVYALILMSTIFILSPLREEMYSWYFIWIIPLAALVKRKGLMIMVYVFSFGLLLGYIPYMLLGSYIGVSALLRFALMFTPLIITVLVLSWKKKLL